MQMQPQNQALISCQPLSRIVRFTLILFLFICSSVYIHAQNNNEIVTNKTIIDLKGAGISKDIIKTMISSANCKFETDAQSVIKLKKAGVEDEVITAMIEKMNGTTSKTTTKTSAAKTISEPAVTTNSAPVVNALKREGSGIYQRSGSGISELEPTVYSQAKQSGNFVRGISGGFAKSTTKMSVSGARANLQVTEKKPVFYFVFNITSEDKGINSQTPLWFTNASSPNEFMLVKFLTGKDNKVREVVVASGNDYSGTAQGVDDKQKISFKYTRLEKGIYEIYFEEDLQPGEYCFMYAGSMSVNGVSNPKVYDFGMK